MPSTLNETWLVAGAVDVDSAEGGASDGAHPRLMVPHVATRAIAKSESVFRMIQNSKIETKYAGAQRRDAGYGSPQHLKFTGSAKQLP